MIIFQNPVSRYVLSLATNTSPEHARARLEHFARTGPGRVAHAASLALVITLVFVTAAVLVPLADGLTSRLGPWRLIVLVPLQMVVVFFLTSAVYGWLAARHSRH
jgi:hypothetical protein